MFIKNQWAVYNITKVNLNFDSVNVIAITQLTFVKEKIVSLSRKSETSEPTNGNLNFNEHYLKLIFTMRDKLTFVANTLPLL